MNTVTIFYQPDGSPIGHIRTDPLLDLQPPAPKAEALTNRAKIEDGMQNLKTKLHKMKMLFTVNMFVKAKFPMFISYTSFKISKTSKATFIFRITEPLTGTFGYNLLSNGSFSNGNVYF